MPARPPSPLHLPPPLPLSSPSSPIFLSVPITGSWVVEEEGRGPIVRCFGFLQFKSSSQSGREGTRGRQQPPFGDYLRRWMGLGARRGPPWCDGMKYNKPEFARPPWLSAGCSFRRLKFSLWFIFHILCTFPFVGFLHSRACVFFHVCAGGSARWRAYCGHWCN